MENLYPMIFKTKTFRFVLTLGLLLVTIPPSWAALNLDRLSAEDIKQVKNLIVKLAPLIEERDRQQSLSTLTFPELYAPLNKEERKFLRQFEKLDAKKLKVKIPYQGIATGKEDLVMIRGQKVKTKDGLKELSPKFLPPDVYKQYLAMMQAMEKDIGKRLYIDSGYRSSAYQLYLFVFYLSNHDYSIKETVKFVALVGYSEHGAPKCQAIDFINADGINGEENVADFENLEENKWLLANAGRFGFILSYPKNAPSGITYEPWHWHYESQAATAAGQ